MPPLALSSLLQSELPWLSSDGRAVLHSLVCSNGRVGSAQALCRQLGLRNRFQLNRLLRREGLPSYEELSGWVCVFYWMLEADAGVGRGALLALARQTPMETASSYRLVRRVTSHSWKDLRRAGTARVLRWFRERVHLAGDRPGAPRPVARASAGTNGTPTAAGQRWVKSRSHRVTLDGGPYGIAVRGDDFAYVTLGHGASLAHLDLAKGCITGVTSVGCTPTCVRFDESGHRAYVTVQYCDAIAVLDAVQHTAVRSFPLSGQPFPLLIARNTLFVTTNTDRLWALNPENGRVMGSLPLPATSHHLALHPDGDRLYVATRAGGSVLEVDAIRMRVLRTFALGGWTQGLVVSPDGTLLYVANEQHQLDVVHLSSGRRVATVDDERGAVALALSPDGRLLYTGHAREGTVGVIDTASLTHQGTLVTGGRPGQIAFAGAGHAVITNEAGWIDILPLGKLEVVAA
jgi:DNA-binding beta-propeller fold protein YncE